MPTWRNCSVPTKSKLVYLKPADDDFREVVQFHIQEAGPKYGRQIYRSMRETIEKLRTFPLLGQIHPDPMLAAANFRKLVLTKTYVAIYKIEGDTVYIYRIVNGATDYPKLLR